MKLTTSVVAFVLYATAVSGFAINPTTLKTAVSRLAKPTEQVADDLKVGEKDVSESKDWVADAMNEAGETGLRPDMKESTVGSPLAHGKDRFFPSLFGGFDDFFAPPSLLSRDPFAPFFARSDSPFMDSTSALRNFPLLHPGTKLIRSLSPGYEIKEHDGTYEIAVQIPDGVKASEVAVEVENDGTVLYISGEHHQEDEKGKMVSETRFEKRFTIGANVDTDNITANLSDGVLVLTAPKLETEQKRKIAITENPHVVSNEKVIQKSGKVAQDEK